MKNPCPKCGELPEEINALVRDPDPATSWNCGSWLNAPDAPAPGFMQSKQCRLAENNAELLSACKAAKAHVEELREAWRTGALRSFDGKNAERSNRNVDVETLLRKAIAKVEGGEA